MSCTKGYGIKHWWRAESTGESLKEFARRYASFGPDGTPRTNGAVWLHNKRQGKRRRPADGAQRQRRAAERNAS